MSDSRSWQPPFAHLNLRRNPFGELSGELRGELAVIDLAPIVDHLRDDTVVQFVGARGRGKSTALQALAVRLDGAIYRRVSRDGELAPDLEADILLVDELQCLDRTARRALWRRDAALAFTTHTDLTDEIRRAGQSVETIDMDGHRSIDELATMFRRRIEAQRRDEGPVPTIARETVCQLRDRYGSDHRAMQDHLYEVFQALEEPRPVEPADLEAVEPPEPEIEPYSP